MSINYTPEEISEILNNYFSGITHKQYIGARYVPIFGRRGENTIEWDNSNPYEALTIVLHNGNSYTSRQPVPRGIDITNNDYWALTGNYNAQVEQYRQEVAHFSNAISSKMFSFDTVEDMKDSISLFKGAICETLGFHSVNDGGGATYYIDDSGTANEIDVISCGDDDEFYAKLIINDSIYIPEQFGAYGDGIHSDSDIIQYIIDKYDGGTVYFNCKTYLIDKTLRLKRGITLLGASTFDDLTDNSAATIKMDDHANVTMIATPGALGGDATHFMRLENLLIDANGRNQDYETICVNMLGAYIGSSIENVYIKNFFGTALNLRYADIYIADVWLQDGYTTHNWYALTTNALLEEENLVGSLVDIDHIYIENYSNKINGNPRTTPADRADAINLYKTVNININEIHLEGVRIPFTIEKAWAINIDSVHTAWCGNGEGTAMFLFKNAPRVFNACDITNTSTSTYTHWVLKDDGFTSNEITDIVYESNKPAISYLNFMTSNISKPSYMHEVIFENNVSAMRIGQTDFSRMKLYTDADSLENYGYIKSGVATTRFGSTKNQSGEHDFIGFESNGGTGDRVLAYEPLAFSHTRSGAGNVYAKSLYYLEFTDGNSLAYQRTTGNNSGIEMVATVKRGTTAPSDDANYIGQIYVDKTHKVAYIATSIGNGANDWTSLN